MRLRKQIVLLALGFISFNLKSQDHHVPRAWNEAILNAIRNDFARPTIHARNLFHASIALYDTWALFDETANTYLIGREIGEFQSSLDLSTFDLSFSAAEIEEAASYAVYRLGTFRFANSPGVVEAQTYFDSLMNHYGYNTLNNSIDYTNGSPAALGNFIATEIIYYGLLDGANEQGDYGNEYYSPINEPLVVESPGNPNLTDPNRWQPLAFNQFIDQSGNIVPGSIPEFLSPEWGNAVGFSLTPENGSLKSRDGDDYLIHHDPGPPPYLSGDIEASEDYKWGFELVAIWSSHLDAEDGVEWDISPASIGNMDLPTSQEEYEEFYNLTEGGDWSKGHSANPFTNEPYEPQLVPRGDYARVLAEFWADGPDSETPPGHWFSILNYVMDHELFERKFEGEILIEDPLEYEVKAYFALGAAMHDAAIAAWSIKGWYDYVRPISALRYMADQGQCTSEDLPNYHPEGLRLKEGYIELVEESDPLVGTESENLGKIKLKAWRGPDFVQNEATDEAGVGWILAENWWPYQRPTFVTPPFAGYVSGHSTYSRTAAVILTLLTGDPYFPGGMGEFIAEKDEFLVFEDGPSKDVILQWATYVDASDQCSLSRIWGGIHPPVDDIPGRIIGEELGNSVFQKVEHLFNGEDILGASSTQTDLLQVYPNPVKVGDPIQAIPKAQISSIELFSSQGDRQHIVLENNQLSTQSLSPGIYFLRANNQQVIKIIVE